MATKLNGTLSLWTRISMEFQGIFILLKIAAVMALVTMVLMLLYFVKPQGEIGGIQYLRYQAWNYGTRNNPAQQLSASWANVLPKQMGELIKNFLAAQKLLARDNLTATQRKEVTTYIDQINLVWQGYTGECSRYGAKLKPVFYASFGVFVLCLGGGWLVSRRNELFHEKDRHIRGGKLTTPRQLKRLLRSAGKGIIDIGGVIIPRRFEIGHFLFLGRPQQGKTVAIKKIMDAVMLAGQKMIIFDSKGDFTASHCKSNDYIFAPAVDERTVRWTIFNDISDIGQVSSVVAAIIPETQKDLIWSTGARRILEAMLYHCIYAGKRTNRELWRLCNLNPVELKELLATTPGCGQAVALLDKPEGQTSFGFFINIQAYLKPLQLIAGIDGDFSIRKWLTENANGEKQAPSDNIFITSTLEHLEILRPLHALFLSILINAHLSLPDNRERRIFYVLDELPVLNKIPRLMDALNFGASKGLCAIIGAQALTQIDGIYGKEVREAIFSAVTTHTAFSVGGKVTAQEMADLIGRAELERSQVNLSVGLKTSRDGATAMEQRVTENIVLPEQIKDLHPLHAYLKVIGYPAAKIKLVFKPYKAINVSLQPDPTFDVCRYFLELKELENRKCGGIHESSGGRSLAPEEALPVRQTSEAPATQTNGGVFINLNNLQDEIDTSLQ